MKRLLAPLLVLIATATPHLRAQNTSTGQLYRTIETAIAQGSEDIETPLNSLLNEYSQRYTEASPQYADALLWAARACMEAGDLRQAHELLRKSETLAKTYGAGPFEGRDTVSEIFRLDLRAQLERQSHRDAFAVHYSKRACTLKQKHFGPHSEPYLAALLDLSQLYSERLKHRKSNEYHNRGYTAYVERIQQEFCQVSESERSTYWESAVKYINRTLSLADRSARTAHRGGSHSLASAAYDAMLLSKGLLLNTSIGFEDYVNNSGIPQAIAQLRTKKALAEQQAPQHMLDSMDYVILDELRRDGQPFRLSHLGTGWKDVTAQMGPEDLAIEFYVTEDGNYGAILLKRDWKSPRVVRLPGLIATGGRYLSLATALDRISLERYTDTQAKDLWTLSRAVWTDDIVKHFPASGKGRIYFSADGELQVTAIEYLPFVEPRTGEQLHSVADLFDVYRLSSTRELAVDHPQTAGNMQAAIYGGLQYDMLTDDLVADARRHRNTAIHELADATQPRQRALRSAVDPITYLEGTQNEVDSIMATINSLAAAPLLPTPYTGERGTEASFKALSGQGQRLIHVATHGYFYNESDSTFARFGLGDSPMVRSGLLMAGADNKWFGDPIPQGVDDGFLTSLEISNLDLRGLDLVVLSACETGKGNIKGDGVFGLQRGFKMASARSILMSLWKVDDEATCLLMTEFYRNWMGGKTKHDALEAARAAVRSHTEHGWDDPRYWAAFILLDALD